MTIAEAVDVLNERKHRDCAEWFHDGLYIHGEDRYDILEEFEAVAIAEKYQREVSDDRQA